MSEKENVKNLLTNSKSRLNIILVFLVLLVLVLMGMFFVKKNSSPPKDIQANVGNPNSVAPTVNPGTSQSRLYNEQLNDLNKKNSDQADKSASTYLPTLVNNNSKNVDTEPEAIKPPPAPAKVEATQLQQPSTNTAPPANYVPANEVRQKIIDQRLLRKQQEEAIAAQAANARKQLLDEEINERKKSYVKQLSIYVGEWTPNQQFVENAYKDPVLSKDVAAPTSSSGGSTTSSSSAQQEKQVIAVAGSFIPSVLISGVNTDYVGPVVAKIVSGTLKDAVATGSIVVGPDGAMLKFNKLQFSDGTSTRINAYAVSSDAYSYKMETDVDHHYLSNYATLFAGAFLQGYGQAEQTAGQTTTVDPTTGTVTQSTSQLSTSQITQKAGGNVAQTVGGALISKSQRPPTITIDVGTPFSILLVDNLAI